MSTLTKAFKTLAFTLFYVFLSMIISSCSGDDDTDKNKFDHPHAETIDFKKHLFEHEFAQQCIAKETIKLKDKKAGQERLAESCMCFATYLFKDLTAKDSYTFLNDKKHAQALRSKYEDAANQFF